MKSLTKTTVSFVRSFNMDIEIVNSRNVDVEPDMLCVWLDLFNNAVRFFYIANDDGSFTFCGSSVLSARINSVLPSVINDEKHLMEVISDITK